VDWSERTRNILLSLSAVVVPIVVLFVGKQFEAVLKEREVQGRFVEMAVAILKEPASSENRPLRTWATQVVNKYSGVPLSAQTQESLISKLSLPYYGYDFGKATVFAGSYFRGSSITGIRAMLAELGHYKGRVDDSMSPESLKETVAALRQFQIDQRLAATGWPTQETIDELTRAVMQKRAKNAKPK